MHKKRKIKAKKKRQYLCRDNGILIQLSSGRQRKIAQRKRTGGGRRCVLFTFFIRGSVGV
jgi:hypothetical protein